MTIPDTVSYMGNQVFYNCSGLMSVSIGSGIKTINNGAFRGCSSLTSVTIPNTVTSIGDYAFYDCNGLTTLIVGRGVQRIGQYAFQGCSSLATVTFNADSCTTVMYGGSSYSYSAFYNLGSVTTFTIGEHVKSIPTYLCYGMSGLTSITIPDSVVSVGTRAFYNCNGITSVAYNADSCHSGSIFDGCNNITTITFGDHIKVIPPSLCSGKNRVAGISIPASVVSIEGSAFSDCSGIVGTLVIPDNVTNIGYHAFYNCTGITSVTIGEKVSAIGQDAFYGCSGLTSVVFNADSCISDAIFNGCNNITAITFGNTIKTIPSSLCSGWSGLSSVTIPNSVTSIGNSAFYGCSGLTSITIPNSVTSIGNATFSGCSGIVGTLAIPDGINAIGNRAFYNCSGITALTIARSISTIGQEAFNDCSGLTSVVFNADSCTTGNYAPFLGCTNVTSFVFGDSVKVIPSYLCRGLSGLLSVTIPGNVTAIGNNAFYGCSSLTDVTIPDAVTSIGMSTFNSCSGLTSVTIGRGVKTIGQYAFQGCSSLATVAFNADSCTTVRNGGSTAASSAFYNLGSVTTFTFGDSVKVIPMYLCDGLSGLLSVTIPGNVASIGSYAFYGCSGMTTLTVGRGVQTIGQYAFLGCSSLATVAFNADSCTTVRNGGSAASTSAFYNLGSVTTFTFGDSVKAIPMYLCYGLSGLASVTIPQAVVNIGREAFTGCTSLATVNFNADSMPDLSYVSNGTTYYYTPFNAGNAACLTTLNIGSNVKRIPGGIFYNQTALTSITIPDSVHEIGPLAMMGCTGLNGHLYIPESVSTIAVRAFSGCNGLVALSISDAVTSIGNEAFYNCHVDTLVVGSGLASIGTNAFNGNSPKYLSYNCQANILKAISKTSLRTVVIGDLMTAIQNSSFSGCTNLTSVHIPNSIISIGDSAFYGCTALASVPIGSGVTAIGRYAFCNCSSLASITIGRGITTIGSGAFKNCNGLTTVAFNAEYCTSVGYASNSSAFYNLGNIASFTFGNNVKTIPDYLCYGLSGLTTVTIPDSVQSIGNQAFGDCSGLVSVSFNADSCTSVGYPSNSLAFYNLGNIVSFTFGNNVKVIPAYLCYGLSGLTTVTIPNSVISMGSSVFYGCSGLTSVSVGSGIKAIGTYAFYGCTGLSSFVIPNGVTSIGAYAFYGCDGLEYMAIPDSVTVLGNSAFYGCSAMDSITIGSGINQIGAECFHGCNSLNSITIEAPTAPYITFSTWNGHSVVPFLKGVFIRIPCGSFESYESQWSMNDDQIAIYDGSSYYYWSYWSKRMAQEPVVDFLFTAQSNDTAWGEVGVGHNGLWFYSSAYPTPARCTDSTVLVKAFPAEHYHLDHWSNGYTGTTVTIRVSGDSSITAYFAPDRYYLSLQSDDASHGTVSGSGNYDYLDTVLISATGINHYHFIRWSDGSTQSSRRIVITGDISLTAYFEIDTYTVSVTVNDETRGYVRGGGNFVYGSPCTVEATPYTGYAFAGWSNGVTANPYIFRVEGDVNLTAVFTVNGEEVYTVTAESADPAMGSATVNGAASAVVVRGQTATLAATPNSGYHFVCWNDYNTQNPRTVTVTGNVTYTAYFEANGSDGIGDVEVDGVNICCENGRIHVRGAHGMLVRIYDMMGREISGIRNVEDENIAVSVPAAGVYLVKVGNYPARRVVVVK